jgi:hypothetical protein
MWLDLEARADGSFFTSWAWISNWLQICPRDNPPRLLIARLDDRIVGLALLSRASIKRLRVLPSSAWYLHECGRREIDTLTVESNGFLVDRSVADITRLCMMLATTSSAPHRLRISAATDHYDRLCRDLPAHLVAATCRS